LYVLGLTDQQFLLKDFENSIITYQYALQLVDKSKKLNQDERAYLKEYILDRLITALNIIHHYENIEKYTKKAKELSWDRDNVQKRIVENFPMNNNE